VKPLKVKLFRAGMLVALFCLLPRSLPAGVIRGTLSVASRPVVSAAMNPYPGQAASMTGMHMHARGLPGDAVLYVDNVPPTTESALAAATTEMPRLAQKDQCFMPRVLAIAAGTTVDFPNLDPIYHNVFSLSPVRRFDLGKYSRGKSRQVVFPKAGLVKIYCDIHSDMEAFVLVLPHHGFARPSSAGEFALPDLPAGRYVLHAWHPDLGEQSTTVDVPQNGAVIANLDY
jgi:plastocyanin